MQPVKFEGMNCTYTAPDCFDLPAMAEEGGGISQVTSFWKPSAEDLQILNAGGCVGLCVRGGQPPVALWVEQIQQLQE